MKLDLESIKKILGNNNEAMIYGFEKCLYVEVFRALSQLKFDVINFYCVPEKFNIIDFDNDLFSEDNYVAQPAKAYLTSLIIENYKRSKQEKAMIPLIFCISLDSKDKKIELDLKKVAQSKAMERTSPDQEARSITDRELRRSYRIFTEISPELKKIAEQTFKFVRVNQHPLNKELYSLEEIKPFWQETIWEKLWKERDVKKTSIKKPHPWKEMLAKEIQKIDSQYSSQCTQK